MKPDLDAIRADLESYIAFECAIHGGTGTGLTMCYSHEKGHENFKEWLDDGGLMQLLDHIDKLETEVKKAINGLLTHKNKQFNCNSCKKVYCDWVIDNCPILKLAKLVGFNTEATHENNS